MYKIISIFILTLLTTVNGIASSDSGSQQIRVKLKSITIPELKLKNTDARTAVRAIANMCRILLERQKGYQF